MKNQAYFSSKDKSKKLKCRLLQFLFGALRVKLIKLPQKGFEILEMVSGLILSARKGIVQIRIWKITFMKYIIEMSDCYGK